MSHAFSIKLHIYFVLKLHTPRQSRSFALFKVQSLLLLAGKCAETVTTGKLN